jgi:hypothetical protein
MSCSRRLVPSDLWAPVELSIPRSLRVLSGAGRIRAMIMRVLTAVVLASGLRGRMAARPVPRIR